jgi:hypothetical protein
LHPRTLLGEEELSAYEVPSRPRERDHDLQGKRDVAVAGPGAGSCSRPSRSGGAAVWGAFGPPCGSARDSQVGKNISNLYLSFTALLCNI